MPGKLPIFEMIQDSEVNQVAYTVKMYWFLRIWVRSHISSLLLLLCNVHSPLVPWGYQCNGIGSDCLHNIECRVRTREHQILTFCWFGCDICCLCQKHIAQQRCWNIWQRDEMIASHCRLMPVWHIHRLHAGQVHLMMGEIKSTNNMLLHSIWLNSIVCRT